MGNNVCDLLRGRWGIWGCSSVVSLRSTTGYFLASRWLARKRPQKKTICTDFFTKPTSHESDRLFDLHDSR